MYFDRYFELTLSGIKNLSKIKRWIDNNIGIEYEVDLETDSPLTSSCGVVTLFFNNTE